MIYRPNPKHDRFTVLPNQLLREETIKPESLGVLCYLLSHRDDWTVTNKQISTHFKISTSRVTAITNDLRHAGYIQRIRPVLPDKTLGWDWLVSDERDAEIPDLEIQDPKNQDPKNQDLEIQDLSSTVHKELLKKKRNTVHEEASFPSPPQHVTESAWELFWQYKTKINNNRKPSEKMINLATADFETLAAAGHRDFSALVNNAINRGWKSIGKPDWAVVAAYKSDSDRDELLGAVR